MIGVTPNRITIKIPLHLGPLRAQNDKMEHFFAANLFQSPETYKKWNQKWNELYKSWQTAAAPNFLEFCVSSGGKRRKVQFQNLCRQICCCCKRLWIKVNVFRAELSSHFKVCEKRIFVKRANFPHFSKLDLSLSRRAASPEMEKLKIWNFRKPRWKWISSLKTKLKIYCSFWVILKLLS